MPLHKSEAPPKLDVTPSAPLDHHIIDEERLAKALEKRGVIKKGLSKNERTKAVETYIEKKQGEAEAVHKHGMNEEAAKAKERFKSNSIKKRNVCLKKRKKEKETIGRETGRTNQSRPRQVNRL